MTVSGVAGVLLLIVALSDSPHSGGSTDRHGGAPASPSSRHAAAASQSERAVDPSRFSPGSCVEFSPTSGNRHLTVFVDAGHGGIDPGAVGQTQAGQTVYEANQTLPTELYTMALLRAQGFTVVVSRTTDSSVTALQPDDVSGGELTVQGAHDDVAARDECADLAGANLLVGIYFDAGASQYNAGSVTAYDSVRPFAASNLRIANLVQTDVLASLNSHGWGIPNDGVVSDAYLGGPPLGQAAADYGHLLLLGPAMDGYFTTPSDMPGTLIEPLFITDPFEATIAASAEGQEAIARGIDLAVVQYFAPPAAPTTSTTG